MSLIKKCFVSRWGEDGVIMEADFSQLEVVGVAVLSGDPALCNDLAEGKDLHCMSASFLFEEDYDFIFEQAKVQQTPEWVKKRSQSKSPTFQLQYGAGYKSIAKKCGLPESQARTFVENYYSRYSVLKQWQEVNIEQVVKSREPTDIRTPTGVQLGRGELLSLTGRRYVFMEEEAPEWLARRGTFSSFQPTQIKNYPSQGFATGDIVPMCLGELYYHLKASRALRSHALLINTVHDSVILDVHKSVLEEAEKSVEKVLTSAPDLLHSYFGIHFDLPLNVEISSAPTWAG